jgi:hypothetical protein
MSVLEIDEGEHLPVGVADAEALAGLVDRPGRREGAGEAQETGLLLHFTQSCRPRLSSSFSANQNTAAPSTPKAATMTRSTTKPVKDIKTQFVEGQADPRAAQR